MNTSDASGFPIVRDRAPYGRRQGDEVMHLPEGKTCGDCSHFRRCNLMFGHIAADEVCDWAPSRFHLAARAETPAPGAGHGDA